ENKSSGDDKIARAGLVCCSVEGQHGQSCDALCAKAAMVCTGTAAHIRPALACGDVISDTVPPFPVCRCCALGPSLSRATLALVLALWVLPAAANQTIGGACTTGTADSPQSADGNNVVCLSSVWQYPAYQHGDSTASCNATNAGMVRYHSGSLQY